MSPKTGIFAAFEHGLGGTLHTWFVLLYSIFTFRFISSSFFLPREGFRAFFGLKLKVSFAKEVAESKFAEHCGFYSLILGTILALLG